MPKGLLACRKSCSIRGSSSNADKLFDVAERLQEALRPDQCVGPCRRVGLRLAVVRNPRRREEVAEPFVDVQLARIADGFHAIAEPFYTSQWGDGIGASLEDEGWGEPWPDVSVG